MNYLPSFGGTTTTVEKWKDWAKQSPVPSECMLMRVYHYKRPKFEPLSDGLQHRDRFGDYACLIKEDDKNVNIIVMINLFLDIYDTCRGYFSYFDPPGIAYLRKVVAEKNLSYMNSICFDSYNFDYLKIHAHVVACNEQSVLLLRILSHNLSTNRIIYDIPIRFRSLLRYSEDRQSKCVYCKRDDRDLFGRPSICEECLLARESSTTR